MVSVTNTHVTVYVDCYCYSLIAQAKMEAKTARKRGRENCTADRLTNLSKNPPKNLQLARKTIMALSARQNLTRKNFQKPKNA